MKKEIINQIEKAYVAISNAECVNDVRVKPNIWLRNQLITIEEIIKEILEDKEEL